MKHKPFLKEWTDIKTNLGANQGRKFFLKKTFHQVWLVDFLGNEWKTKKTKMNFVVEDEDCVLK